MAKHKLEQNCQHINETQCHNNFFIWKFCDKTTLHKPTRTLIMKFT